jgi:hypothetical protein
VELVAHFSVAGWQSEDEIFLYWNITGNITLFVSSTDAD